jgi:hypothetical protein
VPAPDPHHERQGAQGRHRRHQRQRQQSGVPHYVRRALTKEYRAENSEWTERTGDGQIGATEIAAAAPLADVQVALGPWRAATDLGGMVCLKVLARQFTLPVWKCGFEAAPQSVAIAGDVSLRVEIERLAQDPTVWNWPVSPPLAFRRMQSSRNAFGGGRPLR